MRDDWRVVSLGDVCDLTKGTSATLKTPPGPYPLVVTGAEPSSAASYQIDGEAVCVPLVSSTGHGHASLKRVHYASGRFAVANIVAACTPKPDAGVDMRWLWLYLHHRRDDLIVTRMKGTANVSLSLGALAGVPVVLPTLAEQYRVVDLVGTLDVALEAVRASRGAAERALARLRHLPVAGKATVLGAMGHMRSGPSWAAAAQSSVPVAGGTPVLGITNTPAGQALDLTERKYVTGLAESVQKLTDASLVMIRTNGNRDRIGNVYRTTPEVRGFAVSAFQIAIEPNQVEDSDYLFWYLGGPEVQASISANASGSTGLGNVAIGWLKQLPVPTLTAEDRRQYLDRCGAAGQVLDALIAQKDRLLDLRANLLTALLSGEHEVPDTYDELLAG